MNIIQDYKNDLYRLIELIDDRELESACELLLAAYKEKHQIFVAGNGGSAGTANHFSCDFGKMLLKVSLIALTLFPFLRILRFLPRLETIFLMRTFSASSLKI